MHFVLHIVGDSYMVRHPCGFKAQFLTGHEKLRDDAALGTDSEGWECESELQICTSSDGPCAIPDIPMVDNSLGLLARCARFVGPGANTMERARRNVISLALSRAVSARRWVFVAETLSNDLTGPT